MICARMPPTMLLLTGQTVQTHTVKTLRLLTSELNSNDSRFQDRLQKM
jgi:hypothetical protein